MERDPVESAPVTQDALEALTEMKPLVVQTRKDLDAAGVLGTVAGQQALLIARRMVLPGATGAEVATLSKQLSVTLADALKSKQAADPLDELRQRRDAKRAG